jgi:hypothetical protein
MTHIKNFHHPKNDRQASGHDEQVRGKLQPVQQNSQESFHGYRLTKNWKINA